MTENDILRYFKNVVVICNTEKELREVTNTLIDIGAEPVSETTPWNVLHDITGAWEGSEYRNLYVGSNGDLSGYKTNFDMDVLHRNNSQIMQFSEAMSILHGGIDKADKEFVASLDELMK